MLSHTSPDSFLPLTASPKKEYALTQLTISYYKHL